MWKLIDQGFQNARLTQNKGDSFKQAAGQALLERPSRPEDLVGVACFLASPEFGVHHWSVNRRGRRHRVLLNAYRHRVALKDNSEMLRTMEACDD